MTIRRSLVLGPWRLAAILVCLVLVPFCLWGFQAANYSAVPWERFADVIGPPTPRTGSAPPYLEWDICLMFVTAVIGGLAVLYLAVELWLEIRWNRRRAAAE